LLLIIDYWLSAGDLGGGFSLAFLTLASLETRAPSGDEARCINWQ
jgi:hypothetical protein